MSDEVLVWLSVWSEAQFAYGPANATASENRIISFHLNPDWFYLSGTGLTRLSSPLHRCSSRVVVVVVSVRLVSNCAYIGASDCGACERIQVRITPLTVVFIATAAAIYRVGQKNGLFSDLITL